MLVAISVCIQVEAQRKSKGQFVKGSPTICYLSKENVFSSIGPKQKDNSGARTQSANIEVTYHNFTPEAQAAFQEAVDIWESLLQTDITIHIDASWAPLGTGVLGSAGPASYLSNFDGAPKRDVYYPIALAEKISGEEQNDTGEADIVATFNSTNSDWHYGLTGSNPPAGKYDLVSIVLHEIGHGLGITHGYSVEGSVGLIPSYFNGLAVAYETNIVTNSGANLVTDFTPPSAALKTVLTSDLYYSSPLVRAVNSNNDARLYAPSTYSAGSSVAHLDENTYPAGNVNSLMTPFIGAAERILSPGPIVMNILKDMGWISTVIKHTALKSSENTAGPFHAVATIDSDNGYSAGSVKLHYQVNNGTFSVITMTATGNANEFAANIPGGANADYDYFISVVDNDNRTFTNPGIIIHPGSDAQQGLFLFTVGPDSEPPVITHTPKEFITNHQPLDLTAIVTDNIGIDNVKVEWSINGDPQADQVMTLVADTESTYSVSITFGSPLNDNDKIQYRIRAEDSSVAGNVAYDPSPTGNHEVNVVGLNETADNYYNNFDNLSAADFFGNGFTVSTPSGFENGSINSDHPYAAAGDGNEINLIYNLKTPVRVSSLTEDAIMKFDEIVLVEPGEDGAAWPSSNFFDYVVVEGSKDGGVNWIPLADGYDARYNSVWLDEWNSSTSGQNSTGTGTPSMYRTHTFNLLDKFEAGDEVAFRFRLYSDPFSFGWGWSIDNLKIQIDDVAPTILHQQADFVVSDTTNFVLQAKITDSKGVAQVFFDYSINGGSVTTDEIPLIPGNDIYSRPLILAELGLEAGDMLQYRFRATDVNGNEGVFPSTGFINTAIISLTSTVDEITADFQSESPDLTGNYFNISGQNLSNNTAFTTSHPYLTGIGIDSVSDFSWVTKKAIKVSSDNALVYYEDIAMVEYSGAGVKDYVVVEATKDGNNWEPLIAPYAANANSTWKIAFDGLNNPTNTFYQKHTLDITAGGKFKAGDAIIIRFRLHSDAKTTGWGWAVDNLSIQGTVTGVEPLYSVSGFDAWPNPVTDGSLHVRMALPAASQVNVEFLSTQGQLLSSDRFSAPSGDFQRDYDVNWSPGFYLVRVQSQFGTTVKKIIKLN